MATSNSQLSKHCEACGRIIEFRKKWARNWSQLRYCSDKCRQKGSKPSPMDALVAARIETLAKRKLYDPFHLFADLVAMEQEAAQQLRSAIRKLQLLGAIEVLQGSRVVDDTNIKGPFLIRRT